MAGTNEFKPFATGGGANVTPQATWEASTTLSTGFQSGVASSADTNKAIRQASFITAAIAGMAAAEGIDMLDDGDLATMIANIQAAFARATTPTAGGTVNALTASYTGNPNSALVNGHQLEVKVAGANTVVAPTFQPTLNGVVQVARPIVKIVGNNVVALAVGDLNGVAQLRYDLANTRWILLNPNLWPSAGLSGSFTFNVFGLTSVTTCLCYWTIINDIVHLRFAVDGTGEPTLFGISNAASFYLTGLPANLQPTSRRCVTGIFMANNSIVGNGGVFIGGSGIADYLQFFPDTSGNVNSWTGSGYKGLRYTTDISYKL